MYSLRTRSRDSGRANFISEQFSASTRSAGLWLAIVTLLAALFILFTTVARAKTAQFRYVGVTAVAGTPAGVMPAFHLQSESRLLD